jgi:glycosyltransferase involved in cell wall biosynthesis
MNVLVLTPYVAWPLDHGGRIRSHHVLRALAKEHEVVNLAVARSPREREDAEELEKVGLTVRPGLVPVPDLAPPAKRLAKWTSLALGRSSLLRRWWSEDFAALVREAATRTRFDLVVLDSLWMDAYRPLIDGIPYLASTHNVESDVLLDVAERESGLRRAVLGRDARLLQRREAAWAAGASATVAVSEDDAARFRALAPGARVSVIENGIDADATRPLPPPPSDGPLLFVGSFDYDANVEAAEFLVRDILPRLREHASASSVVIAGRRPPTRVAELALTAGVEVVANPPDLEPHYLRASAVVVPIRTGGGTRIKILEALAWGRPVVTTTPGVRGLGVAHETHLLVADDPAGIAAAVARLRSEPALAARLAAAGRAFVEAHHAWSALEGRLRELVGSIGRRPS